MNEPTNIIEFPAPSPNPEFVGDPTPDDTVVLDLPLPGEPILFSVEFGDDGELARITADKFPDETLFDLGACKGMDPKWATVEVVVKLNLSNGSAAYRWSNTEADLRDLGAPGFLMKKVEG